MGIHSSNEKLTSKGMVIQNLIGEQRWLEEWFSHSERTAELSDDKDKVGFKQEFDELIKIGLENSQINYIDETSLLMELANDTLFTPSFKAVVRKRYMRYPIIRMAQKDRKGSCNFFEFLVEKGIISPVEYFDAYKLACALADRMEYNATMLKNILADFEENQGNNHQGKPDKRYNISDFFSEPQYMEQVRSEVNGKQGAEIVAVFTKYIRLGVMQKPYPSYGALVKDWNFPDTKRLANSYNQAKKGK